MSKENPSFRIMIIDLAEDKVVVDQFADAIVCGIGRNGDKKNEIEGSELLACKCNFVAGVGAVNAAEKAIRRQKMEIIKNFMNNATPEMMAECFGTEEGE